MSDQAESQPDQLLILWLAEKDQAQAQEILDRLITLKAEPIVRRIVGFKLARGSSSNHHARSATDINDVCNNALTNLLTHLASLKAGTVSNELPRNFGNYVAVIAFNACSEYFRDKNPMRYSLSLKLRYLLTHSVEFALWTSQDGREIAGLDKMRGQEPHAPTEITRHSSGRGLIDTVSDIFKSSDSPLTFEALLEEACQLMGVRETQPLENNHRSDAPARAWEQITDHTPGVEAGIADREFLAILWGEICELPLQQRGALLLNLKDSAGGDIQLFDWLGIATVEEIAQVLEMDPARFASLWKDLPLEDTRVAQELGIERQDVINRRSSARKRLANRMKGYSRGN